jgi:deoxyadenosine kinase
VQDRTIYEDTIFAEMLKDAHYMSQRDYNTYINLFLNMTHFLQRPTVILYLDTSPEQALHNVRSRARGCEVDLSLDYLKALRDGYEAWFEKMKNRLTIVRVPWDNFGEGIDLTAIVKAHAPDARWGQKY